MTLGERARHEREQGSVDAHLRQRHPGQRELVRQDLRELGVGDEALPDEDLAEAPLRLRLRAQRGLERFCREQARLDEELSEGGTR
jgi:hypothetical protein